MPNPCHLASIALALLLAACGGGDDGEGVPDGGTEVDGPAGSTWNISGDLTGHGCTAEPPATITLTVTEPFVAPEIVELPTFECFDVMDINVDGEPGWWLQCADLDDQVVTMELAQTGSGSAELDLGDGSAQCQRTYSITAELE